MKCPVCGEDCVQYAHELIDGLNDVFAPCNHCEARTFNKNAPLTDTSVPPVCSCGKRFIDAVIAHVYIIMREEGALEDRAPLKSVGIPLVHPGFAMANPPYLPEKSLVLLSKSVTAPIARRLVEEIPEIRGVVKDRGVVPGLSDIDLDGLPDENELLAGCDVRANVFFTQEEPVVIYKQQSVMHIEFPRGYDPKVISVGVKIRHFQPTTFVDALSGAGKLGIIAAFLNVPHIIFNDAWYAAAYWTAYNVRVNKEHIDSDGINILYDYEEMKAHPVVTEPRKIAESAGGNQHIEVYQGDFRQLPAVLPPDVDLTALDLFEKRQRAKVKSVLDDWKQRVGGEVFIP
ncbi:MAG TPA: hypothetical protein ENN85_01880 [Methanoculleus sp.]|nr:hypothetical protein [Methanoculleus sp.]